VKRVTAFPGRDRLKSGTTAFWIGRFDGVAKRDGFVRSGERHVAYEFSSPGLDGSTNMVEARFPTAD
jgi:hypothetical protein